MTFRTRLPIGLFSAVLLTTACQSDRAAGPGVLLASALSGTPSSLAASANSDVEIGLSWIDNSRNETGYEVQRSTSSGGAFAVVGTVAVGITSYADPGRRPLTQYCYKVRGVRRQGPRITYTGFSNTACETTPGRPPAPTVDASLVAFYAVAITWSSPTATGYRLERAMNAGPWQSVATGTTDVSYRESWPPIEQTVCYRVFAINRWGESPPGADCTTPPAEPTELHMVSSGRGSIDIAWKDNSANEDGYEVLRAGPDHTFSSVGRVGMNVTSYHDSPVVDDVQYVYQVRATKDGGYSWTPGYLQALSPSAPARPASNTLVSPGSSTTIWVTWTDNSDNELGFRVQRSSDGTDPWITVGISGWNVLGVRDADRTPEERVCYRVIAFNSTDSPPSAPACTVPLRGPTLRDPMALDGGVINLAWDDNSAHEDGYEVQRIVCYINMYGWDECEGVWAADLPAGATSWQDTGLNPDETYTYQVLAFNIVPTVNGPVKAYSDASNQRSAKARR